MSYDCSEIDGLDFVAIEPGTDLVRDLADRRTRRPVNLYLHRSSEHQLFTCFAVKAHRLGLCAV
jgi:hypothetical protein